MLDSLRRGQRWVTLIMVTVVGAGFVFFLGVGGKFGPASPKGNAVVQLGDIRMQLSDYQRVRARQEQFLRQQLGEQYDEKTASAYIDAQSLRELVDGVVLSHSARELGLQVGREEVQDIVRQSPAFHDESGRFDRAQFESFATWEYGSQRNFVESMRIDLLRQKMIGLLYDQATVSPAEARAAALYGLEQVRLAYVALDAAALPPGETVEDDTVAEYLDAHRAELEQLYRERQDRYSVPERVRARHILFLADRDAEPAALDAARAKAEAARVRIVAGEAFEAIAAELSEDSGTRESGGDLGEFSRGTHAEALEEAAFALAPGDLSEVIQSDVGFHVIRLEAREPARTRAFEDGVGLELAREEVVRKRAEERSQQLSQQLADAIRGGQSLEDAARELALTLERTPLLSRRPDGFVPGLGAAPEVMSTAFGLDLDHPSSPEIHRVGSRLVLVQLLEHRIPGEAEIETTASELRTNLLAAKRNRMVQDWIDRRRDELESSGELLINSSLVISES